MERTFPLARACAPGSGGWGHGRRGGEGGVSLCISNTPVAGVSCTGLPINADMVR